MSGGYFEYQQYHIDEIAHTVERLIKAWDNKPNPPADPNDPGDYTYEEAYAHHLKPETIDEFRRAVHCLRVASTYAQRIDYLLSGDDSEESFHKRLKEDLNSGDNEIPN